MSILSSNNVGFQLTAEYLKTRNYICKPSHKIAYKSRMFSDHRLWISNKGEIGEKTPLDLEITLFDGLYIKTIHIRSIKDLDLLESMWDAKTQKSRLKFKKKLLSKARQRIKWKEISNEHLIFK